MNHKRKIYQIMVLVIGILALAIHFVYGDNDNLVVNVNAKTALNAPVLTITSRTPSSVNMKFTEVKGATGYQIYRAATKEGTYKKVKTTKALTFKDTETTNSKVYYYKVRAYKKGTSKNSYGRFSAKRQAAAVLGKVNGLFASSSTQGVKLSWKGVSRAKNYRIYRATSEKGDYSYLASTKEKNYVDDSVEVNKTYYYKVRAYALIDGAKYYGNYSSVVSGKKKKATQNNSNAEFQQRVYQLINQERKSRGLSELIYDTGIERAAYKRAVETKQLFSHTRPDGTSCFTVFEEFGISYRACGENIAYGQRTPEEVMDAWMHSEGHKANILSTNFGKVGVGCYEVNGVLYWVQLFTN
ncbi:MAG: hypothetical protein IKL07_10530 [Clostridium sp.]|nr:hypothetical protein [Clostridium sp.]